MKSTQFLFPLVLLFGIGLIVFFVKASQNYLSEYQKQNSNLSIGRRVDRSLILNHLKVPPFKESLSLRLVFWSVTCAPCLQELPTLKNNEGEELLIINADSQSQTENARDAFKKLRGGETFLRDEDSVLQKNFLVEYFPTHILIDTNDVVKSVNVGISEHY